MLAQEIKIKKKGGGGEYGIQTKLFKRIRIQVKIIRI